MRSSSTVVVALLLLATPASAEKPKPFWAVGPAGGAFGLFVEGGVTAGQLGFETFAAAYSGGAFLGRLAVRLPAKYVAFSLGPALGYVEVPGHYVSGVWFEPLSLGVEIDPVCHLRIGLLGAYAQVFGYAPEGALRGALTVGYVMGQCDKP